MPERTLCDGTTEIAKVLPAVVLLLMKRHLANTKCVFLKLNQDHRSGLEDQMDALTIILIEYDQTI